MQRFNISLIPWFLLNALLLIHVFFPIPILVFPFLSFLSLIFWLGGKKNIWANLNRDIFALVTIFFVFLLATSFFYRPSHSPRFGMPVNSVSRLAGELRTDARITRDGGLLLELTIRYAWGYEARQASASGLFLCVLEDEAEQARLSFELRTGGQILLDLDKALPREFMYTQAQPWSVWNTLSDYFPKPGDTYPSRVHLVSYKNPEGIYGLRSEILKSMGFRQHEGFPEAEYGLWQALLLGRQDYLDPAMSMAFLRSGCAHVVALSGMHLTLLSALITSVLAHSLGKRRAHYISAITAILFVCLAGPYPSLVRALVMYLVYIALAQYHGKPDLRLVWLISTPLSIIFLPSLMHQIGFWLSVAALGGILFFATELKNRLRYGLRPALAEVLATGGSALGASTAFSLHYGLAIYPQGIVAGLVLAPLTLVYMAVASFAAVFGLADLLCPPLYDLILWTSSFFVSF